MAKNFSQASDAAAPPARDFPCGVAHVAPDGSLVYVNPQIERFFGTKAANLIGTRLEVWVRAEPGLPPQHTGTLHLTVSATGLDLVAHVSESVSGPAPGFVLVCGPSSSTTDKLLALELTARTVAHEIRNHLSAIKMSLYMLEKDREPRNDDTLHFSTANEEIKRIELFLRDLVGYTRPMPPRLERVSLSDTVHQGLDMARQVLALKSISLSRHVPDPGPPLDLDRDKIQRAVAQLVQNAVEALPRGGKIRVSVEADGAGARRGWLLKVEDNGPGILPEHQSRIFEPFFSTRTHQLGLGLTAVRKAIDAHGGTIRFRPTSGGGATFLVFFPQPAPAEGSHG